MPSLKGFLVAIGHWIFWFVLITLGLFMGGFINLNWLGF